MFATDILCNTIDSDILKKNINADDEELDDRVIINAPFIRLHTFCVKMLPFVSCRAVTAAAVTI